MTLDNMSFTLLAKNHVVAGDLLSYRPRPLTGAKRDDLRHAAFLARAIQLLVLTIFWIYVYEKSNQC